MPKPALAFPFIMAASSGLLVPSVAHGQSTPVVSPRLLCDTHDQVLSIITVPDHGAAMAAVNEAAGYVACVVGLSAYVPGVPQGPAVWVPEGKAEVHRIVVLAVSLDGVTFTKVPPMPQYTAILVEAEPAMVSI
jgi:hypothetical protein